MGILCIQLQVQNASILLYRRDLYAAALLVRYLNYVVIFRQSIFWLKLACHCRLFLSLASIISQKCIRTFSWTTVSLYLGTITE